MTITETTSSYSPKAVQAKDEFKEFSAMLQELYDTARAESNRKEKDRLTLLRRDCRLIINSCGETIFAKGVISLQAVACAQACLMYNDRLLSLSEADRRAWVALLTISQYMDEG